MVNFFKLVAVNIVALTAFFVATPAEVQAQPLQSMSCYDLWFARNQIYANNGYCFKTSKAINAFGRGCFPPFGRLSRSEQRRVGAIKRQERRRGCSRTGGQTFNPPVQPPQGSVYAGLSCRQLWRERNSIFARNGHCFKTRRGIAAFGRGCFPPYGRLGSADRREVNKIITWERLNGCR